MPTIADAILILCAELQRWLGIIIDRPGDVFDLLVSRLWESLT